MKKIYSLLAMAALTTTAMAQVTVDDIAGKYRLVPGFEPTYTITDHGFDPSCIILIEKTGDKTFAIDNFYYNLTNYEGAAAVLNGTFQDAGEWTSYPTVQNIRFEWDNTDMYLYNPAGETEDTQWLFFANNSFRLLPKKTDDGNVQLYLWPNNQIAFTYYTEANGYDNPALAFENLGAWEEGKEGSLHIERLPQYTTVSKRALADTYTVKGLDIDGNEVKYEVTIASEGGESYTMTGLFGSEKPIPFTWDDNDAGIHADYITEFDEDGNTTFNLSSYAPNYNIYISFTEDGKLSFDHALYCFDGENEYVLYNGVATQGTEMTGDVATAWFTDGETYEDLGYDAVPVPYTMNEGEIVLRNFAGTGIDVHVDLNVDPFEYEGYNYYYPNFSGEGCYVDETGTYFMIGDADSFEYGQETIANGLYISYCFYEPSYKWLELSYYSDNSHKWNYLDIYFDEAWEEGGDTKINRVGTEGTGVSYFDLQGRRLAQPMGLGIKVENGKASKFMIK